MPELIDRPSRVTAAGEPPKLIDEFAGRVNTGEAGVSIAHMRSPSGWSEPGQLTVQADQGVHTRPGEWVRYSTPGPDGADYISVCLPAFAPDTVHRDE
jgi:hypothetical protein